MCFFASISDPVFSWIWSTCTSIFMSFGLKNRAWNRSVPFWKNGVSCTRNTYIHWFGVSGIMKKTNKNQENNAPAFWSIFSQFLAQFWHHFGPPNPKKVIRAPSGNRSQKNELQG
jgi:hypothetical protein